LIFNLYCIEGEQTLQKIGHDVKIWDNAKIPFPEKLSIGNRVIIDDFAFLITSAPSRIGDFVHIASFVLVTGGGEFVIEDFAAVSSFSAIFTGNDDYSGKSLTNPTVPLKFRNVTRSYVRICKHALVGAHTTILPGVTIGEGARIGANSLVTHDIPPWQLWAGTPAKFIKCVPSEEIKRMEWELRQEAYDENGTYVPLDSRNDR
jgi:galactoside O-acetyltransferase